jgi:hypothetical protein
VATPEKAPTDIVRVIQKRKVNRFFIQLNLFQIYESYIYLKEIKETRIRLFLQFKMHYMTSKHFILILTWMSSALFAEEIYSQTATNQAELKPIETVEIDRSINPAIDTILKKSLPQVNITDKGLSRTPEEEEAYQKLKRRVIKLYPYALMAKQIYETSAQATSNMSNKEKRTYLKGKEKELRERFENEIKALYTTDGPVLVKLIHRETNKTTYELLRESKSWINCLFYQMAAKNHGYSLKDTHDPLIDKDIENMVQLLKSEGQLPVYSGI